MAGCNDVLWSGLGDSELGSGPWCAGQVDLGEERFCFFFFIVVMM